MVTGRATAVAVDQNDETGNTVYVGGAFGGLWKSTTGASPDITKVRWKALIDDQATQAVGAIAIGSEDSNIVLVGTGEANSTSDSYYGLGILRSGDGGNSWTLISSANNGLRPFHGLAFAKIAFDSDNPTIVVAATASASEGMRAGAEQPANDVAACADQSTIATCRGLYYSYDSGQTWAQVAMVDPAGVPDNGSASDVIYNARERRFYAWSRAHGLYSSPDGRTFTRAADQGTGAKGVVQPATAITLSACPTTPANVQACPMYRGEIALVPGRDEMYVWFVDASTMPVNGGIYQTKDGGQTWVKLDTTGMDDCGDSAGCGTEQGDRNLALAALPNGDGTDLYAGAVNIYRCRIHSNNATCSSSPFVNLTHAYGCAPTGSFSKVHPGQHAFDFLAANPNVMYFGNDGGIYRSIAALGTAAVPAACEETPPSQPYYPFENLNGTMGSMTQFVWFQQHPTDQFTLLGGTQNNGSVAIDGGDAGSDGLTWRSVMAGDGGYTEINPDNTDEWFVANTGLSIERCTTGTKCDRSGFVEVISPATVGADGAFYMPYMLDPQNSSQIILGTCRVWRAASDGSSGATALSQTFDGSDVCAADSPSMVSALTAGGPQNGNGSQVMYAGTADGQIYVSTSAMGTPSYWLRASDSEGFANWNNYPISGIAIDSAVAGGTTAYVTVMGFQTGHVFQTADGGSSWTDITGDLPDAPADGVAIDASTGTIYVATDVGVFSTSTVAGSSTKWEEVGPTSGPGTLPNVAVTRVAIFHPQGQPARLRVSTYGRGIWEMPLPGSTAPDYSIKVSKSELTTYPGVNATFVGKFTAFNGYHLAVTLSCDGVVMPMPTPCSVSAIDGSGNFTVSAGNATAQDFAFRIKAVDANGLTRQAPVTLRVYDFTLGTPQPESISNLVHGNSFTVRLSATSVGSFDQSVRFGCDDKLPARWTCSADPVQLTPGSTAETIYTITTDAATSQNVYAVGLVATSADGQRAVTATISVAVIAKADFSFGTPVFATPTSVIGQVLQSTITVAGHDGYAGTVSFSCVGASAGISPSACVFTPTSVAMGSSGSVKLTVDTTGGTASAGEITVRATDGLITHTAALPFSLTDFSLSGGGQMADAIPGNNVKFTYALAPVNGYNRTVNLSCDTSSLGTDIPCSLTPGATVQLSPGRTEVVTASITLPSAMSASGLYPVTVTAADATVGTLHHAQTNSVQVKVNSDFNFSFGTASATAKAGSTIAAVPLTVNAIGGFHAAISWGVAGCPQLAMCTVSPGTSAPGDAVNLTIATTAPSLTSRWMRSRDYLALWMAVPFWVVGMVVVRRRKAIGAAIVLIMIGLAGCGGGGSGGGGSSPPVTHPGTPAGTYTIAVTGTAGTIVHAQNFTLTVQ